MVAVMVCSPLAWAGEALLEGASDLHVRHGLRHAFHLNARLPDSRQALRVIAQFFRRHLQMQ